MGMYLPVAILERVIAMATRSLLAQPAGLRIRGILRSHQNVSFRGK
jgi:hypothetical protein